MTIASVWGNEVRFASSVEEIIGMCEHLVWAIRPLMLHDILPYGSFVIATSCWVWCWSCR
jgi:hypothetical protein